MEPGILKIYENNKEKETIRDLTETQAVTISDVLTRHNIKHLTNKITERSASQ